MEGSSFRKILQALSIEIVSKYMSTIEDYSLKQQEIQYDTIWVISEDPAKIKSEISLPTNHLISRNPAKLNSKEEKLNMYNPLKEFVSSNMGTFSHL